MAVICTYESPTYSPAGVTGRFVKFTADGFKWCECARGKFGWFWDVRQGTCDESDLPADVAALARERGGIWPPYVDWPAA